MTQTRRKAARVALVVVGAVVVAACGDGDETGASTASSIAVVTSAASPTTDPITTTITTTTTTTPATTTTTPATTTTTTTTVAAEPAGWVEVDDLPAWAFPPCCADTWKAPGPSPALPADGAPLEDGVYFAYITAWSPAQPDTVTLAIHRFERCGSRADLGSGDCADWGPDEVYVEADSIGREIPLDDAFEVGITGFECDGTNIGSQSFRAHGPALARLWSALEADYARWVRGPLDAGVPAGDLTVQLDADPTSPFKRTCYGVDDAYLELVWSGGDGPSLLFQSLLTLDPGADPPAARRPEQLLLTPAALEIREGHPVLYMYEGFRS